MIVVDNGSGDDTVKAVRERFPAVEVAALSANLGFAGGNNEGIRRALELGADHVVLLNNDAEVEPGFLQPLVDEAAGRPEAGALCSKILFADPPGTIWFAGAHFDPRSGYNGRQLGYREHDGPAWQEVRETDRACGAAMLVPRPVLERVGLLDDELFLYVGHTEWSLRARAAGYRLYVVPASVVVHRVSAGSGGEGSPATLYYDLRNLLTVTERHAPLSGAGRWRRRLVALGAHLAQALAGGRRREGVAAVLEGWRDFRRGRLGPRGAGA